MYLIWFHSGTPSVCWAESGQQKKHCNYLFTHDDDGCGHHVPITFSDQWASRVIVGGRYVNCSPSQLLVGPPQPGGKCHSRAADARVPIWLPCSMYMNYQELYSLKVCSVCLYLSNLPDSIVDWILSKLTSSEV